MPTRASSDHRSGLQVIGLPLRFGMAPSRDRVWQAAMPVIATADFASSHWRTNDHESTPQTV